MTRPDGSPVRALVVDDEELLADMLRMALRSEGWDTRVAHDGQTALKRAREPPRAGGVLDIMTRGRAGLTVRRRLWDAANDCPVLLLTAKDAVEDRVAGLTAGGDDYVTKPFSLEEVMARLRGLVRRSMRSAGDDDPIVRVGDLTLDEESYEVERAGNPIQLTPTEFELLRFLMRNPKRVLSREQILDRVWSYDFGGRAAVVELYISYLRKKLDVHGPAMIHTVRGVGYSIRPAT